MAGAFTGLNANPSKVFGSEYQKLQDARRGALTANLSTADPFRTIAFADKNKGLGTKIGGALGSAIRAGGSAAFQDELKLKQASDAVKQRAQAEGLDPIKDRSKYLEIMEEELRKIGDDERAEQARSQRMAEAAAAAETERENKKLALDERGVAVREEAEKRAGEEFSEDLGFKKEKQKAQDKIEREKLAARQKEEEGRNTRAAAELRAKGRGAAAHAIEAMSELPEGEKKEAYRSLAKVLTNKAAGKKTSLTGAQSDALEARILKDVKSWNITNWWADGSEEQEALAAGLVNEIYEFEQQDIPYEKAIASLRAKYDHDYAGQTATPTAQTTSNKGGTMSKEEAIAYLAENDTPANRKFFEQTYGEAPTMGQQETAPTPVQNPPVTEDTPSTTIQNPHQQEADNASENIQGILDQVRGDNLKPTEAKRQLGRLIQNSTGATKQMYKVALREVDKLKVTTKLEQKLIEQYNRETDRVKKAQLKRRINELRG